MPLRCFFSHEWDGCRCRRAGCMATRDQAHLWDGCRCRNCSATRDEGHVWDGCRCGTCSATRAVGHIMVVCTCQQCGRTIHDWKDGYCRTCEACRTCFGTGTMKCDCKEGEIPGWNDWDTMNSMNAGPTTTTCGTCVGKGELVCPRCVGTGRYNSASTIASSCFHCLGKGFLANFDGEPPHYYTKVQCSECCQQA